MSNPRGRDTRAPRSSLSNLGRRRQAAETDGSDEYAARKQELLNVAAHVFRIKGYQRTKIADIAAAAGTDRATVYYYVASKEQLYRELMSQIGIDPAKRSEVIAAEDRPASERLRALMVELMTAFHEHYPLLYIDLPEDLSAVAARDPTDTVMELVKAGERHFAAFRKVVSDGMQDGSFKTTLPPGVAAEAAIGMVCWTFRWFDPEQSGLSGSEIGAAFADFILNGMLATGARPSGPRRVNRGAQPS